MTADEFRVLALALEGATEGVHFGKPDFRANGRVFASIGADRGMVVLTPPEQEMRLEAAPEVFSPCAGAWGRNGCTYVSLAEADAATAEGALRVAHAAACAKTKGRSR